MNNIHGLSRSLQVGLIAIVLSTVGCENGNLFGKLHKSGNSGDTRSLLSDAQTAYSGHDYSRALALYNDILNTDPNNADALYGASAAAVSGAGLTLADVISGVIKQNAAAASIRGVADLVNQASVGGAVSAQDLLGNIDTTALKSVIDTAICRLQKIASGLSTETAPKKDLDLLVNYGVLRLLRALITAKDNNLITVSNVNGNYSIAAGSYLTANCSGGTAAQNAALVSVAQDVAAAYDILKEAVNNTSSNSTLLASLRDDMSSVSNQLLTASATVPQQCIDVMAAGGITVSNFASFDAFTPPTGC